MPIYAYKCNACGHAKDVLQKISDPLLTQCPECGQDTFTKQVTAAGFQLKGSGWYVTDFRDNGKKPGAGASSSSASSSSESSSSASSDSGSASGTSSTSSSSSSSTAGSATAAS